MPSIGLKLFMFMVMTNLLIYSFSLDVKYNEPDGSLLHSFDTMADGSLGTTIDSVAAITGLNLTPDTVGAVDINFTGSGTIESEFASDTSDSNWVSQALQWSGITLLKNIVSAIYDFISAPITLTRQMGAPVLFQWIFGVGFTLLFLLSWILLFLGKE